MGFRSIRALARRVAGMFRSRRDDREFAAELEAHLQFHIEDNLRSGFSPAEARRRALVSLGGVEQAREHHRERRSLPMLETFFQDARFTLRTLGRNPGFALLAMLTLALGIGANTAIFSIINGVLLRPLPFAEPARLLATHSEYPKGPFVFLRDHSRTMQFAANSEGTEFNLTGVDTPERLTGCSVSANWFDVLGVHPKMGRTFREGEDLPGKDNVVILSYSLWQRRFAGDPAIVGRSIALDGASREIIGVMPPEFRFPSPKTELWAPLHLDARKTGNYWGDSYMEILARLRPGVTLPQAGVELASLRPQIVAAFPWPMPRDMWIKDYLVPLQESLVLDARPRLLILLAAVGLLLLIACANVANLQLARSASREREVALRTALGAGRWRIVRQLMTESVLLAALGGALGLLAAFAGLGLLKASLPADTPRLAAVSIDGRVLVFTALLSILTGLAFGAMPALGAGLVNLSDTLKSAGDRTSSGGGHRLSRGLIVGEVAVASVLVIAAGLLVKSLWLLSNASQGYRPESILTARITPNQTFCADTGRCLAFYDELLARVRALPGVSAVATADGLPLSGVWETIPSDIEGHPVRPGQHSPMIMERIISPGYLGLMEIPLLAGRAFTAADASPSAQRVVLVSKSMAERFWPGSDPVGQHVKPRWLDEWWTVVGVVGDVHEDSMTRNIPQWIDGEIYAPYGTHAIRGSGPEAPPAEMTLLLRTSAGRVQIAHELERTVAGLNRDVPVSQVATMQGWISDAAAGPRSTASLFSIFAALALALGAVGIYGVISYSVSRRTREIGIRVALGADRRQVLGLIVGQSARLAFLGVALGWAGALVLTRAMSSLLYGVGVTDPPTYLAVAILLMLVALAASYIPARRATRVDPLIALHYE